MPLDGTAGMTRGPTETAASMTPARPPTSNVIVKSAGAGAERITSALVGRVLSTTDERGSAKPTTGSLPVRASTPSAGVTVKRPTRESEGESLSIPERERERADATSGESAARVSRMAPLGRPARPRSEAVEDERSELPPHREKPHAVGA